MINRPKAKTERILTLRIERASDHVRTSGHDPKVSGFTTDQIGGITRHAGDATGDVLMDAFDRFWPLTDLATVLPNVGHQGRGSDERIP